MVAKQSAFSPLLCTVTFDMTHARIQIILSEAGEGVPEAVNAFKSSASFYRGPSEPLNKQLDPRVPIAS